MFHPPIITTWKDRFTLKILGFLRVPRRNMFQGKLATGPLSISPFSIPHCQEPHTQGCSHLHSQAQAPSHTLLPTNRYPQATPWAQGCVHQQPVYPQMDKPQRRLTQTLEINLGPLGPEILRSQVFKVCLGWKGLGSKWACPTGPTDSLPEGGTSEEGQSRAL